MDVPIEEIKNIQYFFLALVTRQKAALTYAILQAIPRKYSGTWGIEVPKWEQSVNTRFPGSLIFLENMVRGEQNLVTL